MIVFLSGFMGCGKTTVGLELSKIIRVPFFDLDVLIEDREKQSIPDIFSSKGEAYFREAESSLLQELVEELTGIIALGGGTTVREENLGLILDSGLLIYLYADIEILLQRLKIRTGRPLVDRFKDDTERKTYVRTLLTQRQAAYDRAHYTVDVSYKTISQICNEIMRIIDEHDSRQYTERNV